jgi:hypothetical protein
MSFSGLALCIMSKFIDEEDIPFNTLKTLVDKSFSSFRCSGMLTKDCVSFCAYYVLIVCSIFICA